MSIITNVRTIRLEQFPNSIWVEIETDENLTGLGEAWRGTAAIETIIHHDICPWLIGQDSRNIELISRTLLTPYVGFHSASAEIRAASAIDIALWDLAGKRHGIPVYESLGGASRSSIQVYNTCSGYSFNASSSAYNSGTSRRMITDKDEMRGPYDDQVAFTRDAGALAKSLLSEGYKIMKIWPFDPFAAKTQGNWISAEDLEAGLKPFQLLLIFFQILGFHLTDLIIQLGFFGVDPLVNFLPRVFADLLLRIGNFPLQLKLHPMRFFHRFPRLLIRLNQIQDFRFHSTTSLPCLKHAI